MNKITFILALKNRHEETPTWIKENIFDEFDYIVADGSGDVLNKNLFDNLYRKNVKYIKFNEDKTFHDYYEKVYRVSNMIKTPFVMQIDNDDYINPTAIKKCINILINNENISFTQGYISGVNKIKNNYYISDYKENPCRNLEVIDNEKKIKELLQNYKILWYSIYRTQLFQKVWYHCKEYSCKYVVNTEILHGLLSLTFGNFKFHNSITYIRRTNPISSIYRNTPKEIIQASYVERSDIFNYISNLNKFPENFNLLDIFNNKKKSENKKNIIFKIFLFILRKFPFSIKKIIKINNLLIKTNLN